MLDAVLVPGRDPADLVNLSSIAREYIRAAKAESTLRAYRADWAHFEQWCRSRTLEALPATPEIVALYLADHGATHRPSTLTRRLTAINKAHRAAGMSPPGLMENLAVSETLKGIRRAHGTYKKGKQPLFTEDLKAMVGNLPDCLTGIRDRALLLIGYAGAFRRSELAALLVDDITETKEGLVIRIRRSKTDQEAQGREVALPFGSSQQSCPATAYRKWLAAAKLESGPVFRRIDRHGHMGAEGLHKDSIGLVVKRAAGAAGLDPKLYAGHSLRAGLCTQAYMNGARELDIMRQTGHKSLETVRKYIRGRGLFLDNPAAKLNL